MTDQYGNNVDGEVWVPLDKWDQCPGMHASAVQHRLRCQAMIVIRHNILCIKCPDCNG